MRAAAARMMLVPVGVAGQALACQGDGGVIKQPQAGSIHRHVGAEQPTREARDLDLQFGPRLDRQLPAMPGGDGEEVGQQGVGLSQVALGQDGQTNAEGVGGKGGQAADEGGHLAVGEAGQFGLLGGEVARQQGRLAEGGAQDRGIGPEGRAAHGHHLKPRDR